MEELAKPWGWSSHTGTGGDCVAAVMAGAEVIEAHLARSITDPEAGHSLLPRAFAGMTAAIRWFEKGEEVCDQDL
jgi:sialic acid synthase SpsE